MRKIEITTLGVDAECADGASLSSTRRNVQALMVLSALCLSPCDRCGSKSAVDTVTEAKVLAVPTAYSQFEKGSYRAEFAAGYTKDMQLSKGPDGFFLKPDYQWKLEEALNKAGAGEAVPDDVFRQMDNAVLAKMLEKLFEDWSRNALPKTDTELYRSDYVQHLYRHYRNLRYLEALPDEPARRGDGDVDKLIEVWSERDQKAWEVTSESPFFGTKRDPATAGPLEKHLMPFAQKLMKEMTERFPNHDSFDFKAFYLSKIQHAVLDIMLPGITLEAIRDREKRAGLTDDESGFNEQSFETELKKAFIQRAEFFNKSGPNNGAGVIERRVFDMISGKFEEFGQMEHPLELYRHD